MVEVAINAFYLNFEDDVIIFWFIMLGFIFCVPNLCSNLYLQLSNNYLSIALDWSTWVNALPPLLHISSRAF